jgi:hypothetical protein
MFCIEPDEVSAAGSGFLLAGPKRRADAYFFFPDKQASRTPMQSRGLQPLLIQLRPEQHGSAVDLFPFTESGRELLHEWKAGWQATDPRVNRSLRRRVLKLAQAALDVFR